MAKRSSFFFFPVLNLKNLKSKNLKKNRKLFDISKKTKIFSAFFFFQKEKLNLLYFQVSISLYS